MGLFGRKRSLEERFPPDRLRFLVMSIAASIESCIRKTDVNRDAGWSSRFVCGYLLGYPNYVDEIDERLGGAIRKMLFDSIYGPEKGSALFRATMGHFLLDEQQVKLGWGAGAPDGERYFKALENQADAKGASDSLNSIIEIGLVDLEQQTL